MQDLKDHLKHRLNPKTIAKEAASAIDVLVVHGADEFTNGLFNGFAYWPGQSVGHGEIVPMPVKTPEAPEALLSDGMGGFYNSLAPANELVLDPTFGDSSYLTGSQREAPVSPESPPGHSYSPPAGPTVTELSESLQGYMSSYGDHPANQREGMDH